MGLKGSCHCGRIGFRLDETPTEAIACNCSICRPKGYLHHVSTPDKFTFHGARDDITAYTFNTHNIRHQFCKTCGCAPFAEGMGPGGKAMVMVNLRCADDFDLERVKVMTYDGASL